MLYMIFSFLWTAKGLVILPTRTISHGSVTALGFQIRCFGFFFVLVHVRDGVVSGWSKVRD